MTSGDLFFSQVFLKKRTDMYRSVKVLRNEYVAYSYSQVLKKYVNLVDKQLMFCRQDNVGFMRMSLV